MESVVDNDVQTPDDGEILSWVVPADIQVLAVFACGSKTEKVVVSRCRLDNGVLDVRAAAKKACEDMPLHKYVTVGAVALEGCSDTNAKVRPLSLASDYRWPKSVRAIAPLDTLVVVARRQPRVCLTRRNLVSGTRRRRTRRCARSTQIETA